MSDLPKQTDDIQETGVSVAKVDDSNYQSDGSEVNFYINEDMEENNHAVIENGAAKVGESTVLAGDVPLKTASEKLTDEVDQTGTEDLPGEVLGADILPPNDMLELDYGLGVDDLAKDKPEDETVGPSSEVPAQEKDDGLAQSRLLWISGIDKDMKAQDLRVAFEPYGKVDYGKLIMMTVEGRKECKGIVTMKTVQAADDIVRHMNGKQVNGRTIQIEKRLTDPTQRQPELKPEPPRGKMISLTAKRRLSDQADIPSGLESVKKVRKQSQPKTQEKHDITEESARVLKQKKLVRDSFDKIRERNRTTRDEIRKFRSSHEEMSDKKERTRKEVRQMKDSYEQLRTELRHVKDDAHSKSKSLKQIQDEVGVLRDSLSQRKSAVLKLRADIKKIDEEVNRVVSSRVDREREERERLQAERKRLEDDRKKYAEERAHLERERNKLSMQASATSNKNHERRKSPARPRDDRKSPRRKSPPPRRASPAVHRRLGSPSKRFSRDAIPPRKPITPPRYNPVRGEQRSSRQISPPPKRSTRAPSLKRPSPGGRPSPTRSHSSRNLSKSRKPSPSRLRRQAARKVLTQKRQSPEPVGHQTRDNRPSKKPLTWGSPEPNTWNTPPRDVDWANRDTDRNVTYTRDRNMIVSKPVDNWKEPKNSSPRKPGYNTGYNTGGRPR